MNRWLATQSFRNVHRRSRSRHSCGYTLVEMLIVIALLGLAAGMVVPSMDQAHVLRVQAGVRSIVADITFAQADALAYQEGRGLVFDVATNSYRIVSVMGNTIDPDTDVLWMNGFEDNRYIVQFGEAAYADAVITDVNFDGNATLVFDQLGGPVLGPGTDEPGAGGQVTIEGSGMQFVIDVAPFSGRVTVERIEPDEDEDEEDVAGG